VSLFFNGGTLVFFLTLTWDMVPRRAKISWVAWPWWCAGWFLGSVHLE